MFSNEYSVDQVMNMTNFHSIMGKWVDCKRAISKDALKECGKINKNEIKVNSCNLTCVYNK